LDLGIGAGDEKLEWWSYRVQQEVWQYIQWCGYNSPTWQWQTDRQTDTGRQAKTALTYIVAR